MIKKLTLIVTISILLLSTIAIADEPPSPPHRFKGFVIDATGELTEDGTTVAAKVNDIYYNTTVKNGEYGNTSLTEEFQVEGTEGDTIYFYINGVLTPQTAVFTVGGLNINFARFLNLSLDTLPLTIDSVTTSSITTSQVVISWDTNKSANSIVNYGKTKTLGTVLQDSNYTKSHEITLIGLELDTTYYFEVVSYDYSSNIATDNNSGNYYSFITKKSNGGSNPPPGDGGNPPVDGGTTGDNNIVPVAGLGGPYYGIVDKAIYFDSSKSTDKDGYITEYFWDFGDGTNNLTENVQITHVYSIIGNYTVTLRVKDDKGAVNSTTTFAYISTNDTDGDGWSDEAERFYNTDPSNASDYPKDNDLDGIPDSADPDDDNDGLKDAEEEMLGTNSTNPSDVIRILNDYGLFFFIDTNGDDVLDKYYNRTHNFTTVLFLNKDGTFLIDTNNDAEYEYIYDPVSSTISPYQKSEEAKATDNNLSYMFVIIVFAIIVVLVLYVKMIRRRK